MLVCKPTHVGVSSVVCLAVVALTLFIPSAWSRRMHVLALFRAPLRFSRGSECFCTIEGISSLTCFLDL